MQTKHINLSREHVYTYMVNHGYTLIRTYICVGEMSQKFEPNESNGSSRGLFWHTILTWQLAPPEVNKNAKLAFQFSQYFDRRFWRALMMVSKYSLLATYSKWWFFPPSRVKGQDSTQYQPQGRTSAKMLNSWGFGEIGVFQIQTWDCDISDINPVMSIPYMFEYCYRFLCLNQIQSCKVVTRYVSYVSIYIIKIIIIL